MATARFGPRPLKGARQPSMQCMEEGIWHVSQTWIKEEPMRVLDRRDFGAGRREGSGRS